MRSSIFPLTLALVFLFGCNGKHEESGDEPPTGELVTGWPATLETSEGGYSVTVNPEGGRIRENTHFSLDVSVEPKAAGSESITVNVDADMPAHQHGMNTQPELSETGPRKYRAEGMLFHMAGEWVIMVDVTGGGKTERASFPVKIE